MNDDRETCNNMHTSNNTHYFYTVISSRSKTTYHPASSSSPHLLHPQCAFSPHHVSKQSIEAHMAPFSNHATPFISIFDDIAPALQRAHLFQTRNDTHIQILRLSLPHPTPVLQNGPGSGR
ncbi:hypothetical protein J1614_006708 [Plenodomus biglobosus]|nr:hypothetical protein J1614_006708 [Plenodomus biglobosus]